MKLYRYWVCETREIAGTEFRLRDGSNVSPEDAAAKVERRAAILRSSVGRRLTRRESDEVRAALLDLGGRTPDGEYEAAICEEILDEPAPRNAVTRNRYGAEVLNSEDTCFIDVDRVCRPGRWLRLLAPLLACFAAAFAAVRLSEGAPSAVMTAGVLAAIVFAAIAIVKALSGESEPAERAEATLLAKVRALAKRPEWRGLAACVYRTAGGFRILVQADRLAPGSSRFAALARALDADPLYVDLCRKQGCWRARLTPKPERVGVKRPPAGTRFPRPPEAGAQFADWLASYSEAAAVFAVCRPVATVGRFRETDIVRLHDERTGCTSSLPLA